MTQPDPQQTEYEYGGLMASLWDFLRGDTSQWSDRFFFKEIILESGQPALDVGCGTGRLLLDYLAGGIDIDGVDNSPEMLELCRQKAEQMGLRPALYLQTMETLDLPRKYRTIIVPSSSFQLLIDPAGAREALRRFLAHLEPGGTLAMPFMIIWDKKTTEPVVAGEWELAVEKVRPEDGAIVRRWSRSTYDLANQLEHTEDRYEIVRDGAVVASESHSRSPATRWYTQPQVLALLAETGYTNVRLLKEFSREPAAAGDTLFSMLATRPS
ncbi:MAG: class I SAM-dependent methyltransferase [Chloroflexi bacterium]|nr:class I SAM-dependent methyltransferase [Chloroflexota bacterium]MCI0647294.1 class I SAM-dependent methyltransferase [Chloroflexota bacterium]MCI0726940.1 class I SAM-dependent methyltransferase [Chloroflexota bacterium]